MEIWRKINYDYEVSNTGKVRHMNGDSCKIYRLNSGYLGISINGKINLIHRLVAQAFLPNPDDLPCINHKDENKLCNEVSNLEWCTYSYNNNYGHRGAKIRARMIKEVNQYTKQGIFIKKYESLLDAAAETGGNVGNISSCCSGRYKTSGGYIWRLA